MHAKHAARVAAGRAGLAAETRRIPGVPERQRVQLLAHVHRRECDFGRACEEKVVLGLGGRERVVEALQLLLEHARPVDLLRRRGLADALLLGPRLVASLRRVGPCTIGRQQPVERVCGALARERFAEDVGIGACEAEVDHRAKYASSTCATPSSSTDWHTRSATALTRSCAFSTATA